MASRVGRKIPQTSGVIKIVFYGHPDAGDYWESHCKDRLIAGGFTPVSDGSSMYWHSKLKLLLMVYVGDFKMSGPCENMSKGWKLILTSIKNRRTIAARQMSGL